ncbi:hypothetical protein FYM61_02780 [Lactobacillus salivarius]|uniref:hypothetical protein n=1 Tax=Ligilactobacillus salivarius TaxID=1624 RepID=UPI00136B392A|nr:hypothetical protein [Ligilactobacillus salivarius]MYZ67790.1 hypothetical protein [Ligilactobacillus salivarius]
MMKLIKGRKYNTNTATKLIEFKIGLGPKQILFLKRTGEFFLFIDDKKIVPLKNTDAKEWVKGNAPEMYDNIFSEDGGDQKADVHFMIEKSLLKKAKIAAVDSNITLSALIEKALNNYLR